MLHIPPTNLLLLAAKQEPLKKSLSLNEKYWRIFWNFFINVGQQAEKRKDRKSNRTRQKNKRGDSKVESNDRPEIPDWGETLDIPRPPFGGFSKATFERQIDRHLYRPLFKHTVNHSNEAKPRKSRCLRGRHTLSLEKGWVYSMCNQMIYLGRYSTWLINVCLLRKKTPFILMVGKMRTSSID